MKKITLLLFALTFCLKFANAQLNLTASAPTICGPDTFKLTGGLASVRVIRIVQNVNDFLNLAELEAIELYSGTNVALLSNGATSDNSNYLDINSFPPSNFINGNYNDFTHTAGGLGNYVQVILADNKMLDHVNIVNRGDCCQDRSSNFTIQYFSDAAATQLIYQANINAYQGQNYGFMTTYDVLTPNYTSGSLLTDSTFVLNQPSLPSSYTLSIFDAAGNTVSGSGTMNTRFANNPQTICNNSSYIINGHTYSSAGNYIDTLQTFLGCDSIVTTQLSIYLPVTNNPQTVCYADSYTYNGHTYNVTGNYNDTIQTVSGCDSIIITQLTVKPLILSDNYKSICSNSSYTFNGHSYTLQGVYSDTLQSISGCDSIIKTHLYVTNVPNVSNVSICTDSVTTILGNSVLTNYWFGNSALTVALDTAINFTTPALTNTTTYYVAGHKQVDYFMIDTLLSADSMVVDHDALTGDDRGGIAVTPNYVYVVGDDYTGRFNTDLTNPVQLPMRDGLFSDLKSGKIYSLSSDESQFPEYYDGDTFYLTQLVQLNDTLEPTNNVITLSDTIELGTDNNNSGIFAGFGFLVVYSGNTGQWYAINTTSGKVDSLGYLNDPEFQGSENWADWGVAEYNGTSYSVIFRDYNDNNIHRRVLPDSATTSVGTFSGISDMASLTYSPWLKKWFFHYEGGDTQFNGIDETLGYADASDSTSIINLNIPSTCAAAVTVTISKPVVTVNAANNTICAGLSTDLTANGADTYVWSPSATLDAATGSVVTATPSDTLEYVTIGTDSIGCISDAVSTTVNVNPLPVITAGNNQTVCEGVDVTLTATSSETVTWNNSVIDGVSFSPAVGSVDYIASVTDANQCSNSDTVNVNVNQLPAIDAGNDQAVCDGVDVTLTATSNETVSWNNSVMDGVSFSQAVGSMDYIASVIDANLCSNSDTVNVMVNALPNVSFAISAFDDTLCSTNAPLLALTASPSGGTYSGSAGISGTDFDASSAASGINTITYTYNDGNCQNTASADIFVDVCSGINTLLVKQVSVYPNPTTDFVSINLNNQIANITLMEMSGKLIESQKNANSIVKFNLAGLASGIYLIKVQTEKESVVYKVTKQ